MRRDQSRSPSALRTSPCRPAARPSVSSSSPPAGAGWTRPLSRSRMPAGRPSYPVRRPDLAGNSQSLVLAHLPYGRYRLTVGGEHGTTGAFHLQVLLGGDVNGDRKVDMASGTLIRNIFGSSAGDGRYMAEADANRDGLITSFDYALWRLNLGDTTSLNPLTLVAAAPPSRRTCPMARR